MRPLKSSLFSHPFPYTPIQVSPFIWTPKERYKGGVVETLSIYTKIIIDLPNTYILGIDYRKTDEHALAGLNRTRNSITQQAVQPTSFRVALTFYPLPVARDRHSRCARQVHILHNLSGLVIFFKKKIF